MKVQMTQTLFAIMKYFYNVKHDIKTKETKGF